MTCRLLNFVDKSLYHGVTYGTIEEKCFCYAAGVEVGPLLQATDPLIRDIVLTAYTARVRIGYYGNGKSNQSSRSHRSARGHQQDHRNGWTKKPSLPKPKDLQPPNRTMYRRLEASRSTSSPTTGTPSYSSVPYGRKRICYNVSRATSHRGPRTDRFLLPPTCRRIHKTKNNYPSWAPHACNSHNPIPHQGRRFLQGLKNPPTKITFARSPLSRSSNPQNHKSKKWPNGGDDNSRNSEQSNPRTRGVAMFNTCH